jgi:ADP-heptose:LPS heptosyltransferase
MTNGSKDRTLFITAGPIGDALLTSGLLHRLVESEPETRFTIAAGAAAAPLFSETPRLERLIAIRKQKYSLHWLDLWRQVGGRRWKTVIDMRGSGLAYTLWAQRRYIYRPQNRGPGAPILHKVEEAARTMGFDPPPAPFLYTSAATEKRAEEILGDARPILAISPGANWRPKIWAAERFAATALELTGPGGALAGARILLTGARNDERFCGPLRSALEPSKIVDLLGLDLLTTFACFKRIQLFVGNDSGLMHLAAAAGAPTLGLFGPSQHLRYRPWGPRAAFVRSPRDPSEYAALFETGGFEKSYMTDVNVVDVVRAATDLLERTRDEAPVAAPL